MQSTEPHQLAMVTAAGICLHVSHPPSYTCLTVGAWQLSYLSVNWLLLKLVSLPEAEYKAVWIMASQKVHSLRCQCVLYQLAGMSVRVCMLSY